MRQPGPLLAIALLAACGSGEVPGLPPRRAPEALPLASSELRVVPPPSGLLPAGVPLVFTVSSSPPLEPRARCEWAIAGEKGATTVETRGPEARIALPGAGTWRVEVRSGAARSPAVEVRAYHVRLEPADGAPEVRTALLPEFDREGRLAAGAAARAPERVRVVVDDPWGEPPSSVSVSTADGGGALLNPPVAYALAARATRPFLLVGDPDDDRAEAEGSRDDAPEDPTLLARPRGRVEVFYRGARSAWAGVAPAVLYEVPVRFLFVREPALPRPDELERAVDARLERANAIWEPHGRRFVRSGVEVIDPPGHLLLLRGRAGGTDALGRPGRTGARVDGREVAVSTAWPSGGAPLTPAGAAREFARRAPELSVERFENLLAGDREAVLLRVRRKDGTPAELEPLGQYEDLGQRAAPVRADFSDGCEVTAGRGPLSLEEVALLLGGRASRSEGVDVFVVSRLRASERGEEYLLKVHPDGAGAPSVTGAAVVSRLLVDGGDRYPYGLARAMGEILLPGRHRPGPEDTLFAEPLSEASGPGGHKRVGRATGAWILQRGRHLAAEK